MVISFTINGTTVEINTGGTLSIEMARRQMYASRLSDTYVPGASELQSGEWARKGFRWGIVSSPRG